MLAPGQKGKEFILFNRPHDPEKETWDGYRAGQEGARVQFGANEAFPMEEFAEKITCLLSHCDESFILLAWTARWMICFFQPLKVYV